MAEQEQKTLGRYQIRATLGRGGFATVYRALDPNLNREVALKVLHPAMLADPTFTQRFRREARALAAMRHPNIITIYEVSEADGRLYIAMELADGPSLAGCIEQSGPIPWQETLALLKPVCQALDYAHSQGIVHRDLKPANILIDKNRGPLLTDFGLARLMAGESGSMSMSGGILGTPAYIAPELWEMESAKPSSDIYSLGCIVFEMLTGKLLFSGQTPVQILRAHDRGPQYPAAWPEGVPEGIHAVLDQALQRKPEERYPAATGLWQALEDAEADAREAASRAKQAAMAAEWRAAVEEAIRDKAWGTARMALGRWLAVAPGDPAALAARAAIERGEAAAQQAAQQAAQRKESKPASAPPPQAAVKAAPPPPVQTRQEAVPQQDQRPAAAQPQQVTGQAEKAYGTAAATGPGEKVMVFGWVQVGIIIGVLLFEVFWAIFLSKFNYQPFLLSVITLLAPILLAAGILLPPLAKMRPGLRYAFLVTDLLQVLLIGFVFLNNVNNLYYLSELLMSGIPALALLVLLWLDRARDRAKRVEEHAGPQKTTGLREKLAAFGWVQIGIILAFLFYEAILLKPANADPWYGPFMVFGILPILTMLGIFLLPLARLRSIIRYVFIVFSLAVGVFCLYDIGLPYPALSDVPLLIGIPALIVLLWLDRARDRKAPAA